MITLSKRLETALAHLKGADLLADIGTDHAYLPIMAVKAGFAKRAIAVDNKEKPLTIAKKNIREAGLANKVDTILSDGFSNIDQKIDVVSILGMGGIQISEILNNAKSRDWKRLVLSPNSEARNLRDWLENNGFRIVEEDFVIDKRKHYQIIVAESGTMLLDDLEKEFGPLIIKERSKEFVNYIDTLIRKLDHALENAQQDSEKHKITTRIAKLKGLIE